MRSVNVHDAKTHFSRLLDEVAAGESITIAKAGTPVARLVPLEPVAASPRRTGFLVGRVTVPDDFDGMGSDTVVAAFEDE